MILTRRKLLIGGAASLIASPTIAKFPRGSTIIAPGAGLIINLSNNASWSGAPQYYKDDVIWARDQLQAACPNTPITITVTIGYTEINGGALGSLAANTSSSGILPSASFVSFSTLKAKMAARTNQPAAFSSVVANLPAGTSIGGKTNLSPSWPTCKALGMFSGAGFSSAPSGPNDTSQVDSAMGIGASWSSTKTRGVFLHELSHAMGRIAGEVVFIFSRFTAAGVWDTSSGGATNAFFSTDGGTTNRANFAASSDLGDFADTVIDPGSGLTDSFDASQTNPAQFITPLDFIQLQAMGFYQLIK